MVHSREDYDMAVEASNILFGKSTKESLLKLDEQTLLDVFAGVPHFEVEKSLFEAGVKLADLTVDNASIFPSKGEVKTLVKGGGVSINKDKATAPDQVLTASDLLDGKYLLIQQGKKKYFSSSPSKYHIIFIQNEQGNGRQPFPCSFILFPIEGLCSLWTHHTKSVFFTS